MSGTSGSILFAMVDGGKGAGFGTFGGAHHAMDAIEVFDHFRFLKVDVRRTVLHTDPAVHATLQIPDQLETFNLEQLRQPLKDIHQSGIGTEPAAPHPFGEKSAYGDQGEDHDATGYHA